jgi:uncharacterized membrane protein YccC
MMAYVSILVLQLYDPIWFLINKKYTIAITCSIIALFLSGDFKSSIAAIILGANLGEIIFSIIIFNIHQTIFIRSHFVLDIIAICTAVVYVSHKYYHFVSTMQKITTKPTKRGRAQL